MEILFDTAVPLQVIYHTDILTSMKWCLYKDILCSIVYNSKRLKITWISIGE